MGGNVLVLLSGGLDSAAVVQYYIERNYDVTALFVDYGQVESEQEKSAAQKVANNFKVKLSEVTITGFKFSSKQYVPARNSFLLTIGLAHFKEDHGVIALGLHSGTSYPDCSQLFVDSMQKIFDLYNGGVVSVGAPFIKWIKTDIEDFAVQKNLPLDILCSNNSTDIRSELNVNRK